MSIHRKGIIILGSTGSIGTQTLDVVRMHPERFNIIALTAGRNYKLLAQQALEFRPRRVVIAEETYYQALKDTLAGTDIEVACGDTAIAEAAAMPGADTVVTAMVGYSGLIPTIDAIKAGRRIALANKETLVVGGALIRRLLQLYTDSELVPVDSEHSAIFQCLQGERRSDVRKIILTASGGPFRTLPASKFENVTAADALKHPNWDMGAKVTIDSATMMNKGFEMIEARWLFDVEPQQIEIAVHPQSIVHSMVEFRDGSIKAQLGVPDMRMPIAYALGYGDGRLDLPHVPPLTLEQYSSLSFEHPDLEKFPMLGLAFEAIKRGGTAPCALNAANEVAVAAFLKGEIKFTDFASIALSVMDNTPYIANPELTDLVETHREATDLAIQIKDSL
ncbi:MAG: 1-deoxy-D-xylulose-5-phosphate reductoisomerase [Muribaculaceae bacterium]|nr:1-deoxy-D-xylulose-5-phosphate reductoisomerase [Muribaculaceae bacterium]